MRARLTMTPDRLIGDIKQCATCLAQFVLPRLWYEARAPWNVFALKGFLAGIFASAGILWWTQFCQAANGWYNFFYINKMPVLLRFLLLVGTLFSCNCCKLETICLTLCCFDSYIMCVCVYLGEIGERGPRTMRHEQCAYILCRSTCKTHAFVWVK